MLLVFTMEKWTFILAVSYTKKDDYLTPLAKSKGEDTAIFAKYGERVLTKEENQEFEAYEAAKEEITPTLNKATPVQTVDDLPVIDLV